MYTHSDSDGDLSLATFLLSIAHTFYIFDIMKTDHSS